MKRSVVPYVLLMLVGGSGFAGERIALCTLKVDGVFYLKNKKCIFRNDKDGSFSIGAGQKRRSKYFAYVNLDNGVGVGTWNGKEGESHAGEELGNLQNQHDGCWSNDRAQVCAR